MYKKICVILMMVVASAACTRVETGEIGVRVNMSKQIESNELVPGSWNQTLIGDVLTFPVKDITITLENKTPMTSDNSALQDFDISVVYGINPNSVAELYSTKARSFHAEANGDIYLMFNYMVTLVNNASYKAVRKYKSLEVADNRAKIEQEIQELVQEQLKTEKLDTAMSLSVVQVRNILPNADIMASATSYVKSQNDLLRKDVEVKTAELEAKRMQILSANSTQNIAYINAQANMVIAEAIKAGKVQTILIPHSITMLGSLK